MVRTARFRHERQSHHLLNDQVWKLLGQCCDGELLLIPQDRTGQQKTYRARNQACADAFDYIERLYNPTRWHSTLGYLSPKQYEEQTMKALVAAHETGSSSIGMSIDRAKFLASITPKLQNSNNNSARRVERNIPTQTF